MPQRRRGRGNAWHGRGRRRHVRGFLEPCLLLLLHMGKSHGYELAQALLPFGLGEMDSSLVYRMLRGMESAGLVRSEWEAGATSGPARRVYYLTPEGDRHLAGWVADLRGTDGFLHHFFGVYERHMKEGAGEHH